MKKTVIIVFILLMSSAVSYSEEGSQKYKVTAGSLVVREKPDKNSKKIASIPKDSQVTKLEETNVSETIEGIKANWFKVKTSDGVTGYVFSGFLTIEKKAALKIAKLNESNLKITDMTIIIYYPKVSTEDFKIEEGLSETFDDFNYYSVNMAESATKEGINRIFFLEGSNVINIYNDSKKSTIEIPVKKNKFGYIFIDKNLNNIIYPGIYTDEIIKFYQKFFFNK